MIDGRCSQAGQKKSPNKFFFKKRKDPSFVRLYRCSSFPPPVTSSPLSLAQFRCSYLKRLWAFFSLLLHLHPMLHDDSWLWDRLVDGFVRQDVGAVQVKLVVHDHILSQHRHILHTDLTTQIEVIITIIKSVDTSSIRQDGENITPMADMELLSQSMLSM